VRPEGSGKWIEFLHLIGLEPATFRLVAQCLNAYATAWLFRLLFQSFHVGTYTVQILPVDHITEEELAILASKYNLNIQNDSHFSLWQRKLKFCFETHTLLLRQENNLKKQNPR
jgi:hypothetical protein